MYPMRKCDVIRWQVCKLKNRRCRQATISCGFTAVTRQLAEIKHNKQHATKSATNCKRTDTAAATTGCPENSPETSCDKNVKSVQNDTNLPDSKSECLHDIPDEFLDIILKNMQTFLSEQSRGQFHGHLVCTREAGMEYGGRQMTANINLDNIIFHNE